MGSAFVSHKGQKVSNATMCHQYMKSKCGKCIPNRILLYQILVRLHDEVCETQCTIHRFRIMNGETVDTLKVEMLAS